MIDSLKAETDGIKGIAQLDFYREEWKNYTCKISDIFDGADRMNTIC